MQATTLVRDFFASFHGQISKKILINIFIFSSLLTMLLTAYRLYQEYRHDSDLVSSELTSTSQYIYPILSKSLWAYDSSAVATIVESAIALPYVSHITITDSDGSIYYDSGVDVALDAVKNNTYLYYFDKHRQHDIFLGAMSIYPNEDYIWHNLWRNLFVTLYTQLFNTFLTSIFILLIIHSLVSRHLYAISKFLLINKHNDTIKLELNRPKEYDELQLLIDTINDYRHDISEQFLVIKNKQTALVNEIKHRTEAEKKLILQNMLVTTLFDTIEELIFVVDENERLIRVNRAVETAITLSGNVVQGKALHEIIIFQSKKENMQRYDFTNKIFNDKDRHSYNGYCQLAEGSPFPATVLIYPLNHNGIAIGSAIFIRNITDYEKIQQIHYAATHDYLTNLYNRYYFDQQLDTIITAKNHQKNYVVGMVDLDAFKTINDLFGHTMGDQVLIRVAAILRDNLQAYGTVARQGGDEFVFVVELNLAETKNKIEEILKSLEDMVFQCGQQNFHINASIGISSLDLDNDTVSTVISKADAGCYQVKRGGGGGVQTNSELNSAQILDTQAHDYKMIEIVRSAVKENNLILYAQKIIPLHENSLPTRYEILSRINHHNQLIMPDKIFSSLEHGRVTHLLDREVIRKLGQYIQYDTLGSAKYLNVNLSPLSFNNWDVQQSALNFLSLCQKNNYSACFEITESTLTTNIEHVKQVIRTLKENGGKIAIDDFGTGYASYAYIENLDIDMIKIDGSLIQKIQTDKKIRAIVSSIQTIANSIGAITIAEHVQTTEDQQLLRELGIDYSQSYLHAKPEPLYAVDHVQYPGYRNSSLH